MAKLITILAVIGIVGAATAAITLVVMTAYNLVAGLVGLPTIGFGMTFLVMLAADVIGWIIKR